MARHGRQVGRVEAQRGATGARGQRVQRGVVAPRQDRAARPGAPGQQVDPRHRVAVAVVRRRQSRHQVVQVRRPFRVHRHQGRLYGVELELGREDHPGQAHSARRRPEEFVGGLQRADLAVRRQQVERADMARERARAVMVLAVDVRADRAADRDVPRPGRHRHEPAQRQQDFHQAVQADARLADHHARLGVDRADVVEAGHVQDGAARVLRRVAVRPAQAPCDGPARPAREDRGHRLLVRTRADQPGGRRGGAAPAGHGGGGVAAGMGATVTVVLFSVRCYALFIVILTEMGD